jgi:small subunit ribosomal protein S16
MPAVEARVAIRFTRIGRKKLPFYRIIAIDSRVRRDGAPLEYLGWYNPLNKEANLNAPAIKKWLAVGAQPSDTVGRLLKKAMVMD